MQEQISWDPAIVKKFGSSNHNKLLNQLRNEVIKYPLTKNKIQSNNDNNERFHPSKEKFNMSISQSISTSNAQNNNIINDNNRYQSSTIYKSNHNSNMNSSKVTTETDISKPLIKSNVSSNSNISFNNSKNFSIYNNHSLETQAE